MKTMITYSPILKLLACLFMIACGQLSHATTYEKLESSWYLGGALGLSGLQPEGHANWQVTDENDTAKKVYGGINISRHFSLEAFWNDFGQATVKNTAGAEAKVNYRGYGANLVYHVPSYLGSAHPIVKVGAAKLKTEGDGVSVNQQNNVDLMTGIGVEYALDKGIRIRAEYEYFDKDIDQLSVGLNWRPVLTREALEKPQGSVSHTELNHTVSQPVVIVNNPAPAIAQATVPPSTSVFTEFKAFK